MHTVRRTHLLLGTMVLFGTVAFAACCKSGGDSGGETPTAEPSATAAPTETAATPPEAVDPEWKKKCPDADRPEGGTVTALKQLQIFEKPDATSKKLSDIVPGTWVNLLGAKGTWWCIDYPCDVGKLCPGWVEERYTTRKPPVPDAGADAALDAPPDAPPEAGSDAPSDAAGDAGKRLIINLADAGAKPPPSTTTPPGGKAPPGGRPPTPPKPN